MPHQCRRPVPRLSAVDGPLGTLPAPPSHDDGSGDAGPRRWACGSTPASKRAARSPMHYDSMIAKLIVHGRDRADAIARMREALNAFVIRGISSNIPFQAALLAHPKFASGDFNTGFIAEHYGPRFLRRRCAARRPFAAGGCSRFRAPQGTPARRRDQRPVARPRRADAGRSGRSSCWVPKVGNSTTRCASRPSMRQRAVPTSLSGARAT